jgi:hypothetical protein
VQHNHFLTVSRTKTLEQKELSQASFDQESSDDINALENELAGVTVNQ